MNANLEPEDERLRTLLRGARPAPPLPPRFHEGVWRRIEAGEAPAPEAATVFTRLEQWVERLLVPRIVLASLALLLTAGGFAGVISGAGTAKQRAQQRYLSAVVPATLR